MPLLNFCINREISSKEQLVNWDILQNIQENTLGESLFVKVTALFYY